MEEVLALLEPDKANKILSLAVTNPNTVGQVLSALAADPVTMRRFADDIPPAFEPVTDYITDVAMRRQLFYDWKRLLPQFPPNSTTFDCIMVAPILEIRALITSLESSDVRLVTGAGYNTVAPHAMRDCMLSVSLFPIWTNIFLDLPKGRPAKMPDLPLMAPPAALLNDPGTEPGMLDPARELTAEELTRANHMSTSVSYFFIIL